MKKLAICLSFALCAAYGGAQSLQQYLVLRKQHGVTSAAGVQALETLVGSRVLEIKGIVKGSFRVGERAAIMVERTDGGTEIVDADAIPDWLLGNEVPARLLIRASRTEEMQPLRAVLIGAAPESDLSRIEKDQEARETKAKARHASVKTNRPVSTRGGLFGEIGSFARGRGGEASRSRREWVLPASEVTPIYASFIKKQNRRLSDAEALRIAQGIVGFSLQYGVDARLIMAMVMYESGFDPGAVNSRSGAVGLGQLMPGTARWMGVRNRYDSIDNLYGAVKLLRTHLDTYKAKTGKDFDSLVLTLAAYNAGEGAVARHGGVPPYRETQLYVRRVIAIYYKLAGY